MQLERTALRMDRLQEEALQKQRWRDAEAPCSNQDDEHA